VARIVKRHLPNNTLYVIMLRNYLLTTLRNLQRNLLYSIITIFGFAVGLASFFIIFLYIKSELSYDKSWKNYERTYRITESLNMSGKEDPFALTSFPVAPSIKETVPGIEAMVRFSMFGTQTIEADERKFEVESVFAADSNYYKIFNYTFINGNPETALSEPRTAIISETEAIRLFGKTDVIGKTFKTTSNTLKITGVYKDDDFVSHFNPNLLISTPSIQKDFVEALNADWFRLISYTYLLAAPGTKTVDLQRGIEQWSAKTIDSWVNENELSASASFDIEPLAGIHFNTSLQYDMPSNTSPKYIYIFGAIGIFILLIASINYMNLATAKSIRRAREIGIRKVAGANKSQLIIQFLGEAIIFSLLAMVIALVLIELFTPIFNQITGKNLSLFHETPGMNLFFTWLQVIFIVLAVGLISGSFPAFILSTFKPIHVLKGASIKVMTKNMAFSAAGVRKTLVVLQFVISVSMLISTWVVWEQLQFMRNRNLGFDKNNLMVINLPSDTSMAVKRESLINELSSYSGIEKVSATGNLPGYTHGRLLFFVDDQGQWINKTMNIFVVDDEYKNMLELELNDGRFFSRVFANDDTAAFVVNEAAVKFLGLDKPLGHRMRCGFNVNGKIVGVIKNFYYASLQKQVEPLVLVYKPQLLNRLLVKIKPENLSQTMNYVEEKWSEFDQKHPFSYSFLDTNFDLQYDRERRLLSIFGYFAILIIIISSMGLLGLASFTAEQRTKEFGIRKILGSTQNQITLYLIKEFLILILIAGAIAIPLSFWLMQNWLDEFSNRIAISWTIFFFSMLLAAVIALLTVIFQAIRAGRANPADVLKYE